VLKQARNLIAGRYLGRETPILAAVNAVIISCRDERESEKERKKEREREQEQSANERP